jgi:hypothetical protein
MSAFVLHDAQDLQNAHTPAYRFEQVGDGEVLCRQLSHAESPARRLCKRVSWYPSFSRSHEVHFVHFRDDVLRRGFVPSQLVCLTCEEASLADELETCLAPVCTQVNSARVVDYLPVPCCLLPGGAGAMPIDEELPIAKLKKPPGAR